MVLHWGILGLDGCAAWVADGLTCAHTGVLDAVSSRTQESADAFGAQWHVKRCYGEHRLLLADPVIQVVYIAVPLTQRAEWIIRAVEAKKHVVCEMPFALNHAEAMVVIAAVQQNNVFFTESFAYRYHPQYMQLLELLQRRVIGDISYLHVVLPLFSSRGNEEEVVQDRNCIMEVGCYGASLARCIGGVLTEKPFLNPTKVIGTAYHDDQKKQKKHSLYNEYATALLEFPGMVAQLFTGMRGKHGNGIHLVGSEGFIDVSFTWPLLLENSARIRVQHAHESEPEVLMCQPAVNVHGFEVDAVARCISDGQSQIMSWSESLGNMQTLDLWRAELGLIYPSEDPDNGPGTQLPSAMSPSTRASRMGYGTVAGITKPVSRFILGVDHQIQWPYACVMFDDFYAQGGNCFDTAFKYGGGLCEKNLGQWMKKRGVREQVVVIGKGAHTPYCNPQDLVAQLYMSLERLQTQYVDLYMLHRDNTDIPVDEFIAVLNEQMAQGRISAFGASNWSLARVQKANEWAAAHQMSGFVALSNHFSLARMVHPVWTGCISVEKQWGTWLAEAGVALMPWSSQARGFFTERTDPHDRSNSILVRGWYSADNFQRLARVKQMANERHVLPNALALAYVLQQPFPTFPMIGPRTLDQLSLSLPSLDIPLTSEELAWLNLEV